MEFIERNEIIEDAIRTYRFARAEALMATQAEAAAKKSLLAALENAQEKTYGLEEDGTVYRATRVAPERVQVDTDGLKKKIGARAYNRLTTRTFQNSLLEDAVNKGDLPLEDVQPFLQIREGTPYIKWSTSTKEEK